METMVKNTDNKRSTKTEVAAFFEKLGYLVDYDGCNGGMFWHEIISKKSKKLICQIGYGASINDIISDFSHWYLKIPTITTGESYDVNAEDERAFRRLLKKVYEYNVKNPI